MTKPQAFTLPECLIVLAIIAIILMFAVPNFSRQWQRQKATLYLQQLQHAIHSSVILSRRQHQPMTICPRTPANHCGQDWSQGILIRQGDKLVRVLPPVPTSATLSFQGFLSNTELIIQPSLQQQSANGKFIYQFNTGEQVYLVINRIGRTRLVTKASE
jgi:type IV fimbrial biogenesis protein FimT